MAERYVRMTNESNPWDRYSAAYQRFIDHREQADLSQDPILIRLFECLGDLAGKKVLDACCGEGFLSRLLAKRGAHVTAVDISPRLVEIARTKDRAADIDYRVADLTQPRPELAGLFDVVACHLALNDVADYRAFATALAASTRPGGRLALALNNPYSLVVRGHVLDYFESGTRGRYEGMSSQWGVKADFFHRTMEDYVDALLDAGLQLVKLADVRDNVDLSPLLPEGARFPSFLVLAFDRRKQLP